MDDLDKNQLILLALLVSFVTSIATGIATVALIEQAPSDVTRVINRVVERTVEKVVPTQGASVVTKETTVIVSEEDAITEAIGKLSKSLVAVYVKDEQGKNTFLGLGFSHGGPNTVLTDSALVSDAGAYTLQATDGSTTTAKTVFQNEEKGLAVLEIPEGSKFSLSPIVLSDNSGIKLGQSVMVLSGSNMNTVSTGIISNISWSKTKVPPKDESGDTKEDEGVREETVTFASRILTNMDPGSYAPGTPLINLFGEVVGVAIGVGDGFLGATAVKDLLPQKKASEESKKTDVL